MAVATLLSVLPWTALVALLQPVQAAVVTYDFTVGWVTANPDGAFERKTIGINGQWPIPTIHANVNDTVIVHVHNNLGDQATSLHFHGLFQNGTNEMDGPFQVTQCPIAPGYSMTYNFTIEQPGTYWYHSHVRSQYPDGLRGPLIIHDPNNPYKDQFDEEVVLTVSDWYHDQFSELVGPFISKINPSGAEPVPNNALINETQNFKWQIKPGKTYWVRLINIGAFAAQYVWFEGHNITLIEVDGVYTDPAEASMIYIAPAQRYSFLLTTKNDTSTNYPFVGSMDTTLFDVLPDDLNYNVTGWLVYDDSKPTPDPAPIDAFDFFDDYTLVPHDKVELFTAPDQSVQLDVIMDNLGDGANYAFFNNITYRQPKVPTLYTVLSSGDLAEDPRIYGTYTHSFVLKKGEVVEIVLNNLDSGRHPFHLHGHNFQAVYRSEEEAGTFGDSNVTDDAFPKTPMRRDTFVVWPNGNIVLRFRADNPGVWLFHCHLEWHMASGLIATFVEAPLEIQKTIDIPQDHYDACKGENIPITGNAAANTANFLDLTGEPVPPPPLPAGFTARGIVALVFSIITGIIGVIVVAWYGMSKPVDEVPHEAEKIIAEGEGAGAATHASGHAPGEEIATAPR